MFDKGSLCPTDRTIHLADCKEYTITEVRTVTSEMYDGAYRTLTGVRYIPGLKKNIISVRSFELEGCDVSLQGGVIRVTCKEQIIMKSI